MRSERNPSKFEEIPPYICGICGYKIEEGQGVVIDSARGLNYHRECYNRKKLSTGFGGVGMYRGKEQNPRVELQVSPEGYVCGVVAALNDKYMIDSHVFDEDEGTFLVDAKDVHKAMRIVRGLENGRIQIRRARKAEQNPSSHYVIEVPQAWQNRVRKIFSEMGLNIESSGWSQGSTTYSFLVRSSMSEQILEDEIRKRMGKYGAWLSVKKARPEVEHNPENPSCEKCGKKIEDHQMVHGRPAKYKGRVLCGRCEWDALPVGETGWGRMSKEQNPKPKKTEYPYKFHKYDYVTYEGKTYLVEAVEFDWNLNQEAYTLKEPYTGTIISGVDGRFVKKV